MKVTTLETIAGRSIDETLGVARGSVLWTRGLKKFSRGGIRAIEYMTMDEMADGLNEARERAEKMMTDKARAMGADAVIGLKVEIVEMGTNTFAANAVGTAVKTSALPQAVPAVSPLAAMPFSAVANDADAVILPFRSTRREQIAAVH